jgi:hypothetical protein
LIVFALSDISLRYIELPIRRGVFQYWVKGLKYRTKKDRNLQTRALAVLIAIVFLLASLVSVRAIAIAHRQQLALEKSLTSKPSQISAAPVDGLWVTGDSVILGIRSALGENHPIALINARIGRQAPELLDVMIHDKPHVGSSTVIFDLGNNNALTREQVVSIFETVKDQPKIIVLNTAGPRPWRDSNNALIADVASRYSHVKIVDWNSISQGHPEYFAPDGVHLVPAGVEVYVAEIAKYL